MTYSGLFVMENSIRYDADGLGEIPVPGEALQVPESVPVGMTGSGGVTVGVEPDGESNAGRIHCEHRRLYAVGT